MKEVAPMAANLKNNKHVENLKKGFQDIQTVAQEGNFKLFAKQLVAVVLVFFAFKFLTGKFLEKENNLRGQMEAIQLQQTSEREYETNKRKLIKLEPRFPDISGKNEYLVTKILEIFRAENLTPQVENNQTEDTSNATYVVTSLGASTEMDFLSFAEFLARIENRKDFLKVTEISIDKDSAPENIGKNKISLKFNTIFPKEKIAKNLFKDYDKLVKEMQEEEAAKKGGK